LYAYTCVAPHGGITLEAYPRLRDWLARVEATPGFVPLPAPDAQAQMLIDHSTTRHPEAKPKELTFLAK
jgi:glutathione S-transferase